MAVVHVTWLTSFLWLWFQCVCCLMPSQNTYHLIWVSITLDVEYLFRAVPAKHSHCSLPWMRGISSQPPLLDLECGVAPLSPPAPTQLLLLGCGVDPLDCPQWPQAWGRSSWLLPLTSFPEITPERMKGWSQSKNNSHFWMWLVIGARSNDVKTNIV